LETWHLTVELFVGSGKLEVHSGLKNMNKKIHKYA